MAHFKVGRVLIILVGLVAITCSDDEVATRSYPAIDTKKVTEINPSGANLNAEILNYGSSGISDHGFVYDDVPSPTLDKSDRISLGETTQKGAFSALANRNLIKDKKYYVKAYAITKNSDYVVYGQEVEFISLGGSAPEIEDFIPKQGAIGDTVIILGTGFSTIQTNNKVSFGLVASSVIKAKEDSIWCIVPTNTLLGENELSFSLGQFTIKPALKFVLKPITITSFAPTSASFGDTITFEGLNFPSQKSLINATMLGKDGFIDFTSPIAFKAILSNEVNIPESSITVKAGLQSITTIGSIKLLKPIINSFLPQKGTKDTELTISGNYFSPIKANNKVEINGTSLIVTEASKKTIKAKIPSGIFPGNYQLSITVATQNVISSTQVEIVKPKILTISPLNGTWGNTVTIIGENFGASVADNIVTFNEVQANIISASPTELKVIVPNNLLKKNSVISVKALTVDNLTSTFGSSFTLNPPLITSFTPNEGKSNSHVTIYGENFNPIANNQLIKFGDRTAEVLSATSNQLVVKLPTSLIDNNVNIQIDLAEQTAISSSPFHVISPWRRIEDYPGSPRASAVAFAIGNYGYVTLGTQTSQSFNKPCWQYEPSTNQWVQVHSFFLNNEGHSDSYVNQIAFSIDDNAYVGLGITGLSGPRDKMMKYSSSDDNWYPISSLIGGANEGAVAYSINGKGYVTSGREGSESTSIKMWEYTLETDTWQRKSNISGSSRWEATGFSIGSKAYLVGGATCRSCTIYLEDHWAYDVISDKWTQLANFPGIKRKSSTGFAIGGIGYLVGGEINTTTGGSVVKDFWKYNADNDSWSKLEDFPGERRAEAVVFIVNGKAYYGTGYGPSGYLKDFWEFDPTKL